MYEPISFPTSVSLEQHWNVIDIYKYSVLLRNKIIGSFTVMKIKLKPAKPTAPKMISHRGIHGWIVHSFLYIWPMIRAVIGRRVDTANIINIIARFLNIDAHWDVYFDVNESVGFESLRTISFGGSGFGLLSTISFDESDCGGIMIDSWGWSIQKNTILYHIKRILSYTLSGAYYLT